MHRDIVEEDRARKNDVIKHRVEMKSSSSVCRSMGILGGMFRFFFFLSTEEEIKVLDDLFSMRTSAKIACLRFINLEIL